MFFRAILTSLVIIAAGLSGCTYHMACGGRGCGAMAGPVACDSCGDVGCGGRCGLGRGFGPFGLARFMGTCGAGCGSMYVNEWVNDPPDACDPCDDCGNFIGRRCCLPRMRRWAIGARSLWGFRYMSGSCGGNCGGFGGACGGACGFRGRVCGSDLIEDGEVIYDGPLRSQNGSSLGEQVEPPMPVPTPEPEAKVPEELRSVKKPWRQSAATEYYPRPGAR